MNYFFNVLVALDRSVNALIGGNSNETLSSRAHRMRAKGHRYWGWLANAIDKLLWFDKDHCYSSWLSEMFLSRANIAAGNQENVGKLYADWLRYKEHK